MYLLNRNCYSFVTSVDIYLHSTMYLLNRNGYFRYAVSVLYLHSTMYLLNLLLPPALTDQTMYLHSTMYLLNPVPQHLIISQAYFVLFCRPTIIHGNKICIHQKLSLFTA